MTDELPPIRMWIKPGCASVESVAMLLTAMGNKAAGGMGWKFERNEAEDVGEFLCLEALPIEEAECTDAT